MKKLIERKTDTLFSFQNGVMMVLFCLMSFGLTACSDDDDDDDGADTESYSSLLLGTWYSEDYDEQLIFRSNGIYYYYEDEDDEGDMGYWSLSGSKLTVTDNDGWSNTLTIISLSEDLLIIKGEEEDGDFYIETYYRY